MLDDVLTLPFSSTYKPIAYSRACISFEKAEDANAFADQFAGHVFEDENGL